MIALRRKGIAQQAIDALPGGQHLRTLDFVGQPSLRVDNFARGDVDAKIAGSKTEAAQPLDQFILRHNAGAASRQLTVHPLEDIDVPPGLTQQEPAEQAAHRAADDYCAFPAGPGHQCPASIFPFTRLSYI